MRHFSKKVKRKIDTMHLGKIYFDVVLNKKRELFDQK